MSIPKTQAEALKRLDQLETESKQIRSFFEKPKDIMEIVKTFDDALEIYKESYIVSKEMQSILDYNGNDTEIIALQVFAQMNIIRTVLNEGWIPDWKNSNEYKYYTWFKMDSGLGVSYDGYGHTCTRTAVGSRLCFKSPQLAEYAGKQFIKVYEKFYTL